MKSLPDELRAIAQGEQLFGRGLNMALYHAVTTLDDRRTIARFMNNNAAPGDSAKLTSLADRIEEHDKTTTLKESSA